METEKIIFWNCAGGLKSKIEYIRNIVEKHTPTLIFISEAEIHERDLDVVKIKGYEVVKTLTEQNQKSRIIAYISQKFPFKQLKVHLGIDIIGVDINSTRYIGIYKGFKLPPGFSAKSFFKTIVETLKTLTKTNKMIIVGGDLNIDLFRKTSNLDDIERWSMEAGLQQLVQSYTRERIVTLKDGKIRIEKSAIDHLYTNDNKITLTLESSISDHVILIAERPTLHDNKGTKTKFLVRDWRNYSKDLARESIDNKLNQISTNQLDLSLDNIKEIYSDVLEEIAPYRVIRTKDDQIVNTKIEALKKRRDRYLKKFKKTRDPKHLELAKSFTTTVKKAIKKEYRRKLQCKATSPNPKHFWEAINEARGKYHDTISEMWIDGELTNNQTDLCNAFAKFFSDKVQHLSDSPIQTTPNHIPAMPIKFTMEEIMQASKNLSNKKSFGIDKIPQNFFKDTSVLLPISLTNILNTFTKTGLPDTLKIARVTPLHKKDDKKQIINYRPISSLSVFSKIYERCLLSRLNQELPDEEGSHQHGFRAHHSTDSALLVLQSKMAKILEKGKPGIIYSVDLSAAFDLLRPDKFYYLFKDRLSEGLLFCIMDFLTNRKFQVEMGGAKSSVISLDRGCVQGSILGPKLFTLYLSGLAKILTSNNIDVISYADDTYVIVSDDSIESTVNLTEKTIENHIEFLKSLGMTVNESKTEIMWIGKTSPIKAIKIKGTECDLVSKMKALGILIQGNLSWDAQAEAAISKGKKLVSNFNVLRRYLNEEQFLKAASANYYGAVFYGASVWFDFTKSIYKSKLQSLHFRLLRTATKDFGFRLNHDQLTERCKRATPRQWCNFITASKVMKIIRDKQPATLHQMLQSTYFEESRKPGIGLFYDASLNLFGKQSLENRLLFMRSCKKEWNLITPKLSNDAIRIECKKTFFPYLSEKVEGTEHNVAAKSQFS